MIQQYPDTRNRIKKLFPNCCRILEKFSRDRIPAAWETQMPESFLKSLQSFVKDSELPGYLPDLAKLERAVQHLTLTETVLEKQNPSTRTVNPYLVLIKLSWKHVTALLNTGVKANVPKPEPGEAYALAWIHPCSGQFLCRDARDEDLLALKLVAEELGIRDAAKAGNTTPARIKRILDYAAEQGLILVPESGIRRNRTLFSTDVCPEPFSYADTFTLQWHITQACDLHCRHCYDRSERTSLPFDEAVRVLEDFFDFQSAMNVRGHVTFTGGNPLLYPHFTDLYRSASRMGFSLAILGNPCPPEFLDSLLDIREMTHFQISLEGLEPYNDYIRGAGHFKRSLAFLDALRERGIYAMVMLTLNRDNMDQVLPLAERLKDRADAFTFNRLAMVGEGVNLRLPEKDSYRRFLSDYLAAAENNPILTLKDNLFSMLYRECGGDPFGGCTGYGCGAAFNFVSLLPDGEVHACRKFPSSIGNIKEDSLLNLYRSPAAERYRNGSTACRNCRLLATCRGCPAVVYGMGLDCFNDRDPFCFIDDSSLTDTPATEAG